MGIQQALFIAYAGGSAVDPNAIDPSAYNPGNLLAASFFGDSITQGVGDDGGNAYGGYRGFLQTEFVDIGVPYDSFTTSHNVTGATYGPLTGPWPLPQLMSGLQGAGWIYDYGAGNLPGNWDILKTKNPFLIYVMGGVNDIGLGWDTYPDTIVARVVAAQLTLMRQMYADCPGIVIVLGNITVPEVAGMPAPHVQAYRDYSAAVYSQVYQTLLGEGRRIYFADVTAEFDAAKAAGLTVYSTDGVHPVIDGYRAIACAFGRSSVFKRHITSFAVTSASRGHANINSNTTFQFTATAGAGPWTWEIVSGSLPAGWSLNRYTGILAMPDTGAAASSTTFTVKVTGYGQRTATQVFTMQVDIAISGDSSLLETVNVPMSYQYSQTGGTLPVVWDIAAGSLPTGITLNSSDGTLSGTPTVVGEADFTLRVTDANNQVMTKPVAFTTSATPPFNPGDISNMRLWLKADAAVGGNGTPLTSVTDSSGNGNTFNGSCTLYTGSNGIGGHKAFHFDGNVDSLTGPANQSWGVQVSFVVIFRLWDFSPNYARIIEVGANQYESIAQYGDGFSTRGIAFAPAPGGPQTLPNDNTIAYIAIQSGDVASAANSLNEYLTTGYPFSNFTGTMYVGQYGGGGYKAKMDVAEVIVYDKTLDSTEITNLRNYAKRVYGLTWP